MEGVTILAQEVIRDFSPTVFLISSILISTLSGCIIAAFFIGGPISDSTTLSIIILCTVGFGLILGGVIGSFWNDPIPQYKVTISEEVSMVEFYEKYEIINQEDLIFTVREKDQN